MADRRFDPNDYIDVQSRLHWFWSKHPDGRVETEMVHLKEGWVVFKAMVWKDRNGPPEKPDATGWAQEVHGEGFVNKTSFIENCETSAIGRALANLDFVGSKAVAKKHLKGAENGAAPWDRGPEAAPRASREEMARAAPPEPEKEKAQETEAAPVQDDAAILDATCPFKKHKGKTWRQILSADPQYVEWAVDNVDRFNDEERETLRAALKEQTHASLFGPEEDDLPF